MKRNWQIKGTENFSQDKVGLKGTRTKLNHEAGVDEKTVDPKTWPFTITKGPDHPKLKPFLKEVRLGQEFSYKDSTFRKTGDNLGVRISDGVADHLPKVFEPETQVQVS